MSWCNRRKPDFQLCSSEHGKIGLFSGNFAAEMVRVSSSVNPLLFTLYKLKERSAKRDRKYQLATMHDKG